MNVGRLVCIHDHAAAVIASSNHKVVNRKTLGFLPVLENLQHAVMRGFIICADAAGHSHQEITYFMMRLLLGFSLSHPVKRT